MDTHVSILYIFDNCVYKLSKYSFSVIIKVSLSHILDMLHKLSSLNQSNKYVKNNGGAQQIESYACYSSGITCIDKWARIPVLRVLFQVGGGSYIIK